MKETISIDDHQKITEEVEKYLSNFDGFSLPSNLQKERKLRIQLLFPIMSFFIEKYPSNKFAFCVFYHIICCK